MTDRTVAVVQARMSSSRLPGKVLMPLDGLPLIVFMLCRVARARCIDEIVLATSTDSSDDALAEAVRAHGYAVHRGDLDDVLARYAGALQGRGARYAVRLTGDCPLVDPAVIDRVVQLLQRQSLAYVSNSDPPTFPDGLDVEAFTAEALFDAHAHARLPSEREHVTPYIRAHKQRYPQGVLRAPVDCSALRWTVDHADDLEVVRALVAGLPPGTAAQADLWDLLRVLDAHPALASANCHTRNEGYAKSLALDAQRAAA